ncbi:galactosyltransferase-related protein [Zobellella taiwanensis]
MNDKSIKLEIIMAAYNNVTVMKLALDGYLQQQDKDFSLCVADDGSGEEVSLLVNEYKRKGLEIRHVWHEDNGFRRAKILNESISTSCADYIVFTDNDCIPDKHFVSDHKSWLKRGFMVSGRRVDLGAEVSESLISGEIDVGKLSNAFFLLKSSIFKKMSRVEIALRPPMLICKIWSKKEKAFLGANMAVWREDLLKVNGFDNEFIGYGGEEVDLERRLKLSGVKLKSMRGRGCVYHMYHPERSVGEKTFSLLRRKRESKNIWVKDGIKNE